MRSGLSVSPRSPVGKQPSADRDVGSWPGSGSFSGIGAASAAAVPGFLSTTASSADPREPAWETGRGRESAGGKGVPSWLPGHQEEGSLRVSPWGRRKGPRPALSKLHFFI